MENIYQKRRIEEIRQVCKNKNHMFKEQFENNNFIFIEIVMKSIHKTNNNKSLFLAIGKDFTIKITSNMYQSNKGELQYESV